MKDPNLKRRAGKQPGAAKKTRKIEKSFEIKALKQALAIAREGGIAVSKLDKDFVIMTSETLQASLNNAVRTGRFEPNLSQEFKYFLEKHQELHQLMGVLNYDIRQKEEGESDEDYQRYLAIMDENAELYAALDEFTFDFSEATGKTKKYRKDVLDRYNKLFEEYPKLNKIKDGQLKK